MNADLQEIQHLKTQLETKQKEVQNQVQKFLKNEGKITTLQSKKICNIARLNHLLTELSLIAAKLKHTKTAEQKFKEHVLNQKLNFVQHVSNTFEMKNIADENNNRKKKELIQAQRESAASLKTKEKLLDALKKRKSKLNPTLINDLSIKCSEVKKNTKTKQSIASSKTKELQSLIDKRKNILGSNTILCRLQIDLEKRKKQLKSELKSLRRAKKVAERKKRISLANGVDEIEESSSSDDDYVSIDSCIHASMKVASMKVASMKVAHP